MSSVKVVVNFADKPSYDVRVGAGALSGLGGRIQAVCPNVSSVLIITDSNVAPLYKDVARDAVKEAGITCREITIPAGEASKSTAALSEIWQAMAASHLDRDACVVALGGGVVGDLAGFAAATYMRGVPVVQVPTTLLSMVDSSVGGKTAINLPQGKNLVGAFYQPSYVCADTTTLSTLPEREWACGWGEVVKSALLDSDEFFFWLVNNAAGLARHDEALVREAIARCVVFKANVVAADETERSGMRECLNLGHTLGHAIEQLTGFGTYSHGVCVAEGIRFAVRLGAALYGTPIALVQELDDLFDQLGVQPIPDALDPDSVLAAMRGDKKARKGAIRFVIPHDVGSWSVDTIEEPLLKEHLSAWASAK